MADHTFTRKPKQIFQRHYCHFKTKTNPKTISPTATPTQTHSQTNISTSSISPTISYSLSRTISASVAPTSSLTPTLTPTSTLSLSRTKSVTSSPSNSNSNTISQTKTLSKSISSSNSQTQSSTQTQSPSPIPIYNPPTHTETSTYLRTGSAQFWFGKSPGTNYTGFYITSAGIKTGSSIITHNHLDDADTFYDYPIYPMKIISLMLIISSVELTSNYPDKDYCDGSYSCPMSIINTVTQFPDSLDLVINSDTLSQPVNVSSIYNSGNKTYTYTSTFSYAKEIPPKVKYNMFLMFYPDKFSRQDFIANITYSLSLSIQYRIPNILPT